MNRQPLIPQPASAISANAGVAIVLACLAGVFYFAMIIDHLP